MPTKKPSALEEIGGERPLRGHALWRPLKSLNNTKKQIPPPLKARLNF